MHVYGKNSKAATRKSRAERSKAGQATKSCFSCGPEAAPGKARKPVNGLVQTHECALEKRQGNGKEIEGGAGQSRAMPGKAEQGKAGDVNSNARAG